MTRPTLGREASSPTSGRPERFPRVLASALDRVAHGGFSAAVAGPGDGPRSCGPAGPPPVPGRTARIALVGDPAPAPGAPGAVAPGAGADGPAAAVRDTPGPATDHLIETVEQAAVPLWRAYLTGRAAADRRRLVEFHAPLVRGVAAKLAVRLPASIELADLLQSGTFGLMDAVDRFDPARGIRFDGYAAQRVRGAMLDELRSQDWVPRTVRSRIREVERARDAVQARTGRPATDRELATELGIGLRELRQVLRPVHLVSADDLDRSAMLGPEGGLARLAGDADDPAASAVRRETGDELRAAISQLGDRDRTVLHLYYLEDRTLAEIGALLGVTESRVCQLHARMITRLRLRMEPALAG